MGKRTLTIVIYLTSLDYDSDHVRWEDENHKSYGFGYRSKDKDHKIGLIKCPKCDKENYAPNVSIGICTWCGFNANEK